MNTAGSSSPMRDTLRLAVPLIVSNLSVPLLGIVDTAVVGHLDAPHYLGGVALGSTVAGVLVFAFGFLRMGTTGLTAQAVGAGLGDEVRALLLRALALALTCGVGLWLLTPLLLQAADLIFAPAASVAPSMRAYLHIRLLGLPASLSLLALLGWLLGTQDARGPLALLVVTNGVNIVLDLAFVVGFGWGVRGVAAASVLAEIAGVTLGLWLVRRRLARLPGAFARVHVLDLRPFRRLLAVNRDIFLRTVMLEAAFVGVTAIGSRMGEVILAANAVLLNFQTLAAFGLDGFAHAAEALVGKAVGARDEGAVRAAVRAAGRLALGLSLAMALIFLVFGSGLIALMTDLPEIRAAAAAYLPYLVLSPPVSVWAFLFDGVFIGATRTELLRNAMAVCLAVFAAAVALLVPAFGNHGLWLAFLLFMVARGLTLGLAYFAIERRGGLSVVPAGTA